MQALSWGHLWGHSQRNALNTVVRPRCEICRISRVPGLSGTARTERYRRDGPAEAEAGGSNPPGRSILSRPYQLTEAQPPINWSHIGAIWPIGTIQRPRRLLLTAR